jgi:hypothetical protein
VRTRSTFRTARNNRASPASRTESRHAFFTPYHGGDDETKIRYCRHYAAGLYFRQWAEQWYLEINPTYHFTIDGRRDSYYDAEYVSTIKRMDRNNAVSAGRSPCSRGMPPRGRRPRT